MGAVTRGSFVDYLPALFIENRRIVFLEAIITIIALWAVLSYGFDLVDTVSSPVLVGTALFELVISLDWIPHFADTTRRIAMGFTISVILGTSLGVLMGLSSFWERAFQDYITVGLAFPSLFIAVFAAMAFGISDLTPAITAGIAPFPFVAQNVYQGVSNVDAGLLEMARSFELSRPRTIWRVVFKSVMPEWFAGVRYGFAGAWKLVTLAEVIAAESGVGFMIRFHLNNLSLTGVLTWTILFAAIIMVFEYGVLQQIEARVFEWRPETSVAW